MGCFGLTRRSGTWFSQADGGLNIKIWAALSLLCLIKWRGAFLLGVACRSDTLGLA